ncbi:MAG: transglycosylase domain-containing protein [Prevotellaceae bacterium]|jgi:penicillin-binding protein 1A|nr:transglycosylase domain-containing protein [Prevotellaceae bacterium]
MKISKHKIIKWGWIIFCAPFALFVLMIFFVMIGLFGSLPSFKDLENPQRKLATNIISSDGVTLGTFHLENRSPVNYEDLSPNLVNALISTEDVRFYSHSGIDFNSLARVFVKTIIGGNVTGGGGGSTISQQLALNLFSERSTNKIKRAIQKLQEWVTAVKIERSYTKEEIIAMYLNTVPFGSNAFGISAASQTFFKKNPSDLNIQEAAVLIGLVNGPTMYSPVRNPERALQRRNHVISQMCKYGFLSETESDSIKKLAVDMSKYSQQDHNSGLAPYFREMLKRTMNAKEPSPSSYTNDEDYKYDLYQWENNPLYGWCNKNQKSNGENYNLDRDGLKIYTTIDSRMQRYAEQAVAEHLGKDLQPKFDKEVKTRNRLFSNLKQNEIDNIIMSAIKQSDRYREMTNAGVSQTEILKTFNTPVQMTVFAWKNGTLDTIMSPRDSILYYKSILRAGFMVMQPQTGYIKAYVGGINFRYFKYDAVRQGKRHVGSTIKPFLYTLAMEKYNPCSEFSCTQPRIPLPNNDIWEPKSTTSEKYRGQMLTLKKALALSDNWISGQLVEEFGANALADMCHNMGIYSHLDAVPSLCLGSADVSPFEMVGAYATFANKGVHIEPFFVTRIEDSKGNILGSFIPESREVISAETAYLMLNLMQGVVNHGTATRLRTSYVPTGQIAGKTGTSNSQSDGWFMGTMPTLTGGVWVGAEDRSVHFAGLGLGGGSNMALPIWGIFMQKTLNDGKLNISKTDVFEKPVNITLNFDCDTVDATDTEGEEMVSDQENKNNKDDNNVF